MSRSATQSEVASEAAVDLRKGSPEVHGSSLHQLLQLHLRLHPPRYLVECTCQAEEDRVRRMTGRLFWDVQFDEDL